MGGFQQYYFLRLNMILLLKSKEVWTIPRAIGLEDQPEQQETLISGTIDHTTLDQVKVVRLFLISMLCTPINSK